jgi:guanylate kinase
LCNDPNLSAWLLKGNFWNGPSLRAIATVPLAKRWKNGIQAGKWVVLEIELEGARQIRKTFPAAFRIFILPPSLDELESRIRGRGQDSEDAIVRRLSSAQTEVNAANEFDLQIVNDDLEAALHQIEAALFEPAPVC